MRRKPIVLDSGKLSQLPSGDRLAVDQFSYHTVADEVTVMVNQIMLTTQLEVTDGTLDVEGAVEIL